MRSIFSALAIVLFSTSLLGQTEATEAIYQLKEGTLIVKLIKHQKKIDMLLKQGKKEEAIAHEKEEKKRNESLIQAFSTNYSFSKLLFVYSTDMGKLADGDPTVLFDRDGAPANAIPTNFLFLELGETLNTGVDGFVIRDRHNDQLTQPFPYFVSQWDFLHINKLSFPKMIGKWEKKLHSFYSRVSH